MPGHTFVDNKDGTYSLLHWETGAVLMKGSKKQVLKEWGKTANEMAKGAPLVDKKAEKKAAK